MVHKILTTTMLPLLQATVHSRQQDLLTMQAKTKLECQLLLITHSLQLNRLILPTHLLTSTHTILVNLHTQAGRVPITMDHLFPLRHRLPHLLNLAPQLSRHTMLLPVEDSLVRFTSEVGRGPKNGRKNISTPFDLEWWYTLLPPVVLLAKGPYKLLDHEMLDF